MSDQKETGIVEWGPRETARAYDLEQRLADAEQAVRRRFGPRIAAARGLRRLVIRLRMWRAVHRVTKRVERKIVPPDSLYLLPR